MSTTAKMMIVQPENKSLLVRNVSGEPLDLSSAGDIVRGNASQPSNGQLLYLFTSATEVSVNGETSVSVTTDGSTYNSDVGGKGVDIIFKSGRAAGDVLQIDVSNTVNGQDTYIRRLNPTKNFGTCTTLEATNANPRDKIILIKYEIPSAVKNVFSVQDVTAYFYKTVASGVTRKLQMYVIATGNDGWVEGSLCNVIGGGPTWFRFDSDADITWAGSQGLGTAVTDYETQLLSNPTLGSVNSWIAFTDNSNNFIDYALRMVGGDNVGLKIQTEDSDTNGISMFLASSEYTTDITFRPKLIFVYNETDPVVAKRPKKGLAGFVSLTLGAIDKIVQAEIPTFSNMPEVYRSANRVIGRVNSLFPGVMETELAFTRKVANTTEDLTFASADPDTIVTTTDLSASALPGRVAYVYGTQYNDGLYYIGSVSTVTITLVGASKLIAEGPVSATIAIYDVQAHEILPETNTILTHTTSTMTDSGLNEFERIGVQEDDIIILVGSARNDGAYSIASSSGLEITLQSDEALTAVGPSYGRIRIIRPSLAYQFDTENNELKLPDYVKEVVNVFENNEELTPRSFEYTNSSNNSSQLAFNTKERSKIRFPSGIGNSAGDEIHVKVKKDIIEFLYIDSISSIDIPAVMEEIIIAGTLSLIFAKKKYRDDNSFKFNNDIYTEGLEKMVNLELQYEPEKEVERDYDYFPETTETS